MLIFHGLGTRSAFLILHLLSYYDFPGVEVRPRCRQHTFGLDSELVRTLIATPLRGAEVVSASVDAVGLGPKIADFRVESLAGISKLFCIIGESLFPPQFHFF